MKHGSYALFNLATNGLIPCRLRTPTPDATAVCLHPEFNMGENEEMIYVGNYGAVRHGKARIEVVANEDELNESEEEESKQG